MTRAQLPLLQPALALGPAAAGAVACAPSAWPVAVAFAVVGAMTAGLLWRQHRWARKLWPLAGRMRTARSGRLQLHFEPQWIGLVGEWDLAGALARELRHLGDAWFGRRLRGGVEVYLPRFPEAVARVTGGAGGGAWVRWKVVALPAEPLSEVPRIARHEFAHLLIPKLGPAGPAFKTEGLCVFLQELGRGTPDEFGEWPYAPGGPVERVPPIAAMLDPAFFFDPANRGMCYGLAGWFTFYTVRRFGWPAYVRFFRKATARNFAAAFAATFGVSLAEAEADWRAGLAIAAPAEVEGTDCD